jgi:hypothetical protein
MPALSGGMWTTVATRDEQANLTHTIDGQSVTARYVVGRGTMGGEDEALSPAQYDAVTTGSIGKGISLDPAGALPRGSVGDYRRVAGPDGPERSIGVLKNAQGHTDSISRFPNNPMPRWAGLNYNR